MEFIKGGAEAGQLGGQGVYYKLDIWFYSFFFGPEEEEAWEYGEGVQEKEEGDVFLVLDHQEEDKKKDKDIKVMKKIDEKYKSGKMNAIKGFWVGLLSNLKSIRTKEASSLIYVIKNK